ncbi:hypothetical protein GWK91_11845 [Virgibacillus sp. MSP4-1]|uniref:Uncharacterized protein n=1 Tax=Salinibacillus aidingensis TaxID=237684 RepID=A0ABN1B0E4_9BACI|nr:hypothetical protein [Virgibacillus sp. MSP4-1]QHS23605.1 hypothetical protein GWK91_11845 [Virgibacillus sp. MSP4-1]
MFVEADIFFDYLVFGDVGIQSGLGFDRIWIGLDFIGIGLNELYLA